MLMVASIQESRNGFQVNRTTALFKVEGPAFDLAPDGRRVLVYKPVENAQRSSITLVLNWPTLISKR